jgi:hypothetical protein
MKHCAALLGAILVIFSIRANAQENPNYTLPPVSLVQDAGTSELSAANAEMFAMNTAPVAGPLAGAAPSAPLPGSSSSAASPQDRPTVFGVFQNYSWQIYAGYTFVRFYVAGGHPSVTENMNGLDLGLVYFLPKVTWIGIEGQYVGAWGSLINHESQFDLGMGGARFRWSIPLGMVIWAHGMGGRTTFIPQTAFGGQNAWAYEVGGGLDIGGHARRWGYRVEADWVGTRYFGTYQNSPRISAGIVFKY